MGNPQTNKNIYGIEITDQPYVCLSMGIMTRIGEHILNQMDKFIHCVHTGGFSNNLNTQKKLLEEYIGSFDNLPKELKIILIKLLISG